MEDQPDEIATIENIHGDSLMEMVQFETARVHNCTQLVSRTRSPQWEVSNQQQTQSPVFYPRMQDGLEDLQAKGGKRGENIPDHGHITAVACLIMPYGFRTVARIDGLRFRIFIVENLPNYLKIFILVTASGL